jgi:hypothetical protein
MVKILRFATLGAVGGAVGTLVMDLVWYRRFIAGGAVQPFLAWETSKGLAGYEDAPAPARTARVVAGVAGIPLPDSSARIANNAVHWLTGIGWGQAHGLLAAAIGVTSPILGLLTAVAAWSTSYVVLPRLGVYKPMREYDAGVLWQDLSAHLCYGAALGITFRLLAGRGRRS